MEQLKIAGWILEINDDGKSGRSIPPDDAKGFCATTYENTDELFMLNDFMKIVRYYQILKKSGSFNSRKNRSF